MKQPSFFIVGAPKCGTTALCKYLNRHPDIFIPRRKEMRYFDKDMPKGIKTLDKYLSFFTQEKEKISGEGTPTYLRSKVAAQEIYAFNPEAKIIIMLREPVSLLYSYYNQLLFNGNSEDVEDFKLALDLEDSRRQGKNIPQRCTNPSLLFYRNVVNFTEQIERYLNLFGKNKVYIIIFDEFSKNTDKIYQETLQFLEVDPNFKTEFNKINANRTVKSKRLRELIKYPPRKLLEIGKYFIPLPPNIRRSLLEKLKNKLKKVNIQKFERPPLDKELRKSLQQEFAPEIKRLSALIGQDLTYWSQEDYGAKILTSSQSNSSDD